MADKNFVVKNGIVVNTAFSANSSGIYYSNVQFANTTTANNAAFLGGTAASGYQTTAGLSANVATLTANNAAFLGGTAAAGYQTTAGLSANVATLTANNAAFLGGTAASGYQTTAGLSANVATLTANNTSFVGTVSAANVVSNSQLSGNLSNYQTTAGLNANVAAYLPTYPGNINAVSLVNSTSFTVGSSWTANSTRVVFGTTVGLQANGSIGSANQALFSNGTTVYWANVVGGAGYYKGNQGTAGSVSNANNIFRINANTLSNNVTFDAGENATATGPLTVAVGFTITVSDGATVAII